jgi:hypothetical protein
VFGRAKTPQETPAATAAGAAATGDATAKQGGKGRPTPRRREAEQRNRRPVVGAQRLSQNATKEERKAARLAQREAVAAERAQQRVALQTGDERYLPARDQGPARRWARDHVDARWGPGEFFLPVALVVLFLGFFDLPALRVASTLLLYVLVLVVAVDSFLLQRRVKRAATEKFGETKARGVGMYAVARSLQLRRLRLPRPLVGRGQYPH